MLLSFIVRVLAIDFVFLQCSCHDIGKSFGRANDSVIISQMINCHVERNARWKNKVTANAKDPVI